MPSNVRLDPYPNGFGKEGAVNDQLMVSSRYDGDLRRGYHQLGRPGIVEVEWLSGRRVHLVVDPRIARLFFAHHRLGSPAREGLEYHLFKGAEGTDRERVFGKFGLFNLREEHTEKLRSALGGYFAPCRLKKIRRLWFQESKQRINSWCEEGKIALLKECETLACSFFAKCLFGYQEETAHWREIWKALFDPPPSERKTMEAHVFKNRSWKENFCRGFWETTQKVSDFVQKEKTVWTELEKLREEIRALIEKQRGEELETRPTLIRYLIEQRLHAKAIEDCCVTLLYMAHQKVAPFFAAMMEEYSANWDIQKQHSLELRADWKKAKKSVDNFMARAHCLRRSYQEILRLNPPATVERRAKCPMKLLYRDGREHFIRQDEKIVLLPFLAGRDPKQWRDPQLFEPDKRGWEEREPDNFPFGGGVHCCPGETIALQMTLVFMGTLLRRAALTPAEGRPPLLIRESVRPAEDYKIKILRRAKEPPPLPPRQCNLTTIDHKARELL